MGYKHRIVIFGFGVQGSAQAQNLHENGLNVSVFLRPSSKNLSQAKKTGIRVITDLKRAAHEAQVAVMLIPDGEQPILWKKIKADLPKNAAVVFAHGFNIHYRHIIPRSDLDIILVAPLAHGDELRKNFAAGGSAPCIVAVSQDATGRAGKIALEYAKGIARNGPFINSSFREETETDLFAEQAVLCGGLFELIRAGFDTLVENGYNPDIAYFCCLKEIKALSNLVHDEGIAGACARISDTALFGALTRGPRIINDGVRMEMKKITDEIRSGKFKSEFLSDKQKKNPLLRRLMERGRRHPIEKAHRRHV